MESKLEACQPYIHTLGVLLQEEMSRHAPLYGAGLEALSMKELETLARIHEDGLRQIRALQHQRKGPLPSTSRGSHGLPHGLPHNLMNNGSGRHNNGHTNSSVDLGSTLLKLVQALILRWASHLLRPEAFKVEASETCARTPRGPATE